MILSKIIRPEVAFNDQTDRGKGRLIVIKKTEKPGLLNLAAMFQAGADMSDTSGDEDETVPARVGQAAGRTDDSEVDNDEGNNFFRFQRAAPVYPKNMINHNLDGAATTGMRRTTSSIARISMAIRRSLRLPRRAETRMAAREEQVLVEPIPEGPLFTENTRDTRIGESSVPNLLQEIVDNKRLNRYEKVKKIIRRTDWPVCHEIRANLWKELCNTKDWSGSKRLYSDEAIEYDRINQGKKQSPQILADEGGVLSNFDLKEVGSVKLIRLLLIIERLRPEIVYAPSIYPLCSLLLHFNDDDGDCFACINYLLNTKGYLMTAPVQWAASSHTILALVKKHKSAAYVLLKRRLGTTDDSVLVKCIEDWLLWLFQYLPLPYICRIVDCYFAEGHKFLIRSAISIVYIWSKVHKRGMEDFRGKSLQEKIDSIKKEFQDVATNISVSTSTFIATAVKIRNLQSATIAKLQAQFEDELRDEVTSRPRQIKKVRRTIFCEAFKSCLVDNDSAVELMSYMPPRLQLVTPTLAYQLSQDGTSFYNFWSKVDPLDQTIIIIKSTCGAIFGAYCSSTWSERHDRKERTRSKYWGTGESYVFRMNKEMELPEIYTWVGNSPDVSSDKCPQYFMSATDKSFVIGSGGRDAIRIDEELTHGITGPSSTFNSPQLCEDGAFDIYELEVFHVTSSD
ncbi:Rab-GAP TBC domain-containing protein [Caenorhabditis elegans]|uniref:Rab-GAP TBC domain-containing protein n=2 Tax=Caenorhabditis elegans TaxID=6239 RepID=H2KZ54_CAEEL|nr:Rab-GAP TBC domain-containing protein [Caenorhabditis elegans]CCD66328.2 Rab-GAP TBC domain-containing protein [Caenorhabditis elegans]